MHPEHDSATSPPSAPDGVSGDALAITPPIMAADCVWVSDPDALQVLGEAMATAPWIAIDTESNSMFVYRERVCLLQINAADRCWIVDTLALPPGPEALAPLKARLEDPARTIYVHGGEYDVGCLRRDYGINLAGVWDSQQAASFIGMPRTGYASVVEELTGVHLEKGYTQYDWSTRPLHPEALAYAIDDIRHLPTICQELGRRIHDLDLDDEFSIANQAVMASSWRGGFDPEGFWRISGVQNLDGGALRTLQDLYAWRDQIARAVNLPPGRVLNNELLLSLARTAPTNFQGLKRLRLKAWFLHDHGQALIDRLKAARGQEGPAPVRSRERQPSDLEHRRETRLKDWRREEAKNRNLPVHVVLPPRAIDHLVSHGADRLDQVPQLGSKRIGRYADALRRLCQD